MATDTSRGTTATTPGRNVFQGVVSGNSVTFFGVPVLAAGATGWRVLRITNVRVNANPLAGTLSGAGLIQASISISGSTMALANGTPIVGLSANGLTASVGGSTSLDQCNNQNKALVGCRHKPR